MKKRFIITTFLMLLFVSVALSTATYGWFTMSNVNTLDDFTIQARAASGGLEISLDGSSFSSGSVTMVSPSLKAMDVTSPDGVQFFKATNTDEETGKPTSYDVADPGIDYYEFNLYFRTSNAGWIALDSANCKVEPDTLSTTSGTTTTINNKSSFGEFSRNYIAGAVRVSLKVTGSQDSTSNTWSTNDENIKGTIARYIMPDNTYDNINVRNYTLIKDSSTSEWSVETTQHDETKSIKKGNSAALKYAKSTVLKEEQYTPLTALQKSLVKVEEVKNAAGAVTGYTYTVAQDIYDASKYNLSGDSIDQFRWSDDYALVMLGNLDTTGKYNKGQDIQATVSFTEGNVQITKVTCRIWIEGQDNEAQSALALGKFVSSLSFKFIPSEISSATRLNAPTFNTVSGTTTTTVQEGVISNTNTAKWNQVGGAKEYQIYSYKADVLEETETGSKLYKIADGKTLSDLGTALYTTQLTFQDLEAGVYFIRAISADTSAKKEDTYSYFAKFTVKQLKAPTVTADSSNTKVDTDWLFNINTVTNATKYQYYKVSDEVSEAIDELKWVDITDTIASTTDVIEAKFTSNGTYYIRAINDTEGTVYTKSNYVTIVVEMYTQLTAPTGVAIDHDSSVLSWTKSANAVGYKVYKAGTEPTLVATLGDVDTYTIGIGEANNGDYYVVAIAGEKSSYTDSQKSANATYTK